MKSVMSHNFAQVPRAEIPRSSFNRSHGYKTTFDAGKLIPFFVDEVLPGDTHNLNTHGFVRMATPIYPLMDNLHLDTFYFFCPTRLVWTNFKKMMGEQDNPGDSTDYTVPTTALTVNVEGSNYDYLGLPLISASGPDINNLPLRCLHLIWNEWFRDQNLQNSITVDTDDGPDTFTDYYNVLPRGKRFDYFTQCLPWPQKGTAVDIPLGTDAPVYGIGLDDSSYPTASKAVFETDGTTSRTYANARNADDGTGSLFVEQDPNNSGYPNIRADLSNATAATINQLRQAFQVQKMYEKDARGGTRYIELIRSHFGVTSPDARLQRPEYLGGGTNPIHINPVAQTSSTSGSNLLGDLAAFGTGSINGHGFTKSFTEHGYIIGLMCVRADLTYQKGIDRMWTRQDRLDFYWPSLAHIGEQAVLNKELFYSGTPATDDAVFGYAPRYDEYRHKLSLITSDFRSDAVASLDAWHLSQDFATTPTLNSTFIEEDVPMTRIKGVSGEPDFIGDFYHNLISVRPMPMFGTPGMIDHF
jgi:hypothetical protein